MRETGNSFTARGVLEAAHVLGHGCHEDQGTSARNLAMCGSGGGSSAGADLTSLGVGTARVAMGLALVAIADATSPIGGTKPGLEHAVAAAPSALDRYEDVRARERSKAAGIRSPVCFDAVACPSRLDPLLTRATRTAQPLDGASAEH